MGKASAPACRILTLAVTSQQLAPCTKSRWRTGCANGPADLLCLGLSGPSEPISTPHVPDRTNLLLAFPQASGVMGCLVLWGMRRLLRREWLRAVSCQNVTEGIGSSAFQLRFGTFCSVCRCHSLSRVADCVFFLHVGFPLPRTDCKVRSVLANTFTSFGAAAAASNERSRSALVDESMEPRAEAAASKTCPNPHPKPSVSSFVLLVCLRDLGCTLKHNFANASAYMIPKSRALSR